MSMLPALEKTSMIGLDQYGDSQLHQVHLCICRLTCAFIPDRFHLGTALSRRFPIGLYCYRYTTDDPAQSIGKGAGQGDAAEL